MTGMNALQLHHMISAVSAMMKPLSGDGRTRGGEQLGDARRRRGIAAADFQRSGSLTKVRTRKRHRGRDQAGRNT